MAEKPDIMESMEEPAEPAPATISIMNNWGRKNIWTMLGILIIALIVLYDVMTVQKSKIDVINQCNDFYQKEMVRVCPAAVGLQYGNAPNADTLRQINMSETASP